MAIFQPFYSAETGTDLLVSKALIQIPDVLNRLWFQKSCKSYAWKLAELKIPHFKIVFRLEH